jgi:hypothetical protein
MKHQILFPSFILFFLITFSWNQSQCTEFEPFTGISLNVHANVYLSQGETHDINIEADESVKNKIITKVEDDVLIIKCDKNLNCDKEIEIYVTMKELKLIELNGSGDIICKDSFNIDNIAIEINGSGDIELAGIAENQAIEINGSGDIKSFGMLTTNCAITIQGSGDCEVNVENALAVKIYGSGDVTYKGNPVVTKEIEGSGSVKKY